MNWLKQNLIQILVILAGVTFGYANFTRNIEVNASAIKELKEDKSSMQKDITEIKGDIKTLLERTKKL